MTRALGDNLQLRSFSAGQELVRIPNKPKKTSYDLSGRGTFGDRSGVELRRLNQAASRSPPE